MNLIIGVIAIFIICKLASGTMENEKTNELA